MKMKIKQTFRSMWALVLAVLMLLSTFSAVAVTLNTENSGANLDNLQSTGYGASDAYIIGNIYGSDQSVNNATTVMTNIGSNKFQKTISVTNNWNYWFKICAGQDTFYLTDGNLNISSTDNVTNKALNKNNGGEVKVSLPSGTNFPISMTVTVYLGDDNPRIESITFGNSTTSTSTTTTTTTTSPTTTPTPSDPVSDDIISVLNGTKIMFYIGNEWGQSKEYIYVNDKSNPTTSVNLSSQTGNVRFGAVTAPIEKYYITHEYNGWVGVQMDDKAEAGKKYLTYSSNGDKIKTTPSSGSADTTISSSNVVSTSFTAGQSGAAKDYHLVYYIKDSSGNYSKVGTSASEVNNYISNLGNGTYTLYTCSTDNTITVLRDTDQFTIVSSHNVTVNFTEGSVQVNGNAVASGGTTSVNENEQYTVSVTPPTGRAVDTFTVDGVDKTTELSNNTYTGTMGTSDVAINVTFEDATYTVTAKSNITGGTVYIGEENQTSQTTKYNGEVTVIAVPAVGYIFKGWKSASDATFADSTSATTTATITSNVTIEAEFIPQNSTWKVVGDNELFGIWVTGDAPNLYNTPTTSTDNIVKRDFQLEKDKTYKFKIVNGSTWYTEGSTATTITDSETGGVIYDNDINTTTGKDNNLELTPQTNGVFTFEFNTNSKHLKITKTLLQHTIKVDTTTTNGKVSVVGELTADTGATVTLSNSPNPGYELDSYKYFETDNSTNVTTVTGNTFKMPDYDVTVTATFKKINYSMNCAAVPSSNNNSVICQNSSGQTITTAQMDDTVKFVAQEVSGYTFKEWSIDGADVTGLNLTSDVIEVTVGTSEITATATYEANYFTVASSEVTVGAGSFTVTGLNTENKAQFGSTVTVNPKPADGYELDTITVRKDAGGTESTVDPTNHSFSMPDGDVTITVTFKKVVYTMTGAVADGSPAGAGVTPDPAQASIGDPVTFTVANVTGYKVSNIEVTGTGATYDISADNKTVTVTVGSSNVTVTATYAPEVYNITQTVSGNGSIDVVGAAAYKSTVTIKTTPQTGYVIPEGGVTVTITSGSSTSSTVNAPKDENGNYTFTMPAGDVQVDVRFEKAAYNINKPSESNYTVTIDGNKTTAGYGETVAFTIEPVRSFDTIESVTVTDASGNPVELTQVDGKYTFVMPNSDVTINATHSTTSSGYSIVGSFNSWDTGKNVLIKKNASTTSNYVYTTIPLTVRTHYFKVSGNGSFYGNTGTMTSTDCTDWTFTNNYSSTQESNYQCKLNATVAGDYTFVWNTETKQLSVIYPNAMYYVVGRFKTSTYETDNWKTDDTKMPFTYDPATGNYKLETGQTIKTLSGVQSKTSNEAYYYFWIYTGGTNYYRPSTSNTSFQECTGVDDAKKQDLVFNTSLVGDKWLRFSETDSDNQVPVTLWFDPVERRIWYTAQSSYNITVNETADATITTDKSKAAPNDTVTVTVTPNDSKHICKSVTVTDASGSNPVTTRKNADGTWSFTMPSYDVNVSATVGEPVYYNVTFGSNDSSKGTVTASTSVGPIQNGSTILEGTQVTFVANVVNGNSFQGWYSDSDCTQPLADSSSQTYTTTINSTTTVYAKFTEVTDELFSSAEKIGAYYVIYSKTSTDCPNFKDVANVYIRSDGMLYAKFEAEDFGTSAWGFQVSTQQGGNYAYRYSLYPRKTDGGTFEDNISVVTDDKYLPIVTVESRNNYNAPGTDGNTSYTYQSGSFKVNADYQDVVTSVIVELGRYNSDDGSLSNQPYKVIPSYSASTSTNYAVYAKNGTLTTTYEYGTTTVKGSTSTRKESVEVPSKCTKYYAQEGDALTIKTTVNDDFATQGYSVRAFVISSEDSTETVSVNIDGNTATATYLMPAKNIEITPIYKNSNFTYYPVYLYPNGVNEKWGQEIAVYSYYYKNGDKSQGSGHMNSAYPGEPMMFDGEKYVTYVPKEHMTYNSETSIWSPTESYAISGVTFNNNGNDSIHNSYFLTSTQKANKQTYDFDDFVKIVDNNYDTASFIVQPKYGSTMNKETLVNDQSLVKTPSVTYASDSALESAFTGSTKNGWDRLTDLSGNDISILGYQCGNANGTGELNTTNMLRIVSVGDQDHKSADTNFGAAVGEWSVIWYVYDGSGQLITAAHPSQFVPKIDRDTGEALAIDEQSDAFKAVYYYEGQTNCAFTAAYITYESEKSYASATRLDGRWLYQTSVSTVNVNAKVVYKNAEGNFVEDANGNVATATLDDTDFSTKTVNVGTEVQFNAGSAQGDYKFTGWSTTADNTGIISKTATYTSSINTDTTLYAVYVPLDSGEIKITHNIYKGEGAGNGTGNLSITATVTHNGTNKNYVGTNQVAATMLEGDTLTVKLSTTGTFGSTFVAYYKDDTKITTPSYVTGGTSSTVTLTYQYSELITGESVTRGFNSLDFYSDLKRNGIVVNFKYYDRSVVNNTPADMNSEPSTITFDKAIPDSISNESDVKEYYSKLIDYAADNTVNPSNIVDSYYYWSSQANAVAGIQTKKNYHTENGSNYSATPYHTDQYGNVRTPESPTYADNWVSYQKADGNYIAEDDLAADSAVKTITVWYFNTPKKYSCTMHYAKSTDTPTEIGSTGKYLGSSSNSINNLYYNVRLGTSNSKNDGNAIPNYLKKYGVNEAFVGQLAETAETIGDKQFLYWAYDEEGKNIASTNRYYEYRITSSTTLYAIYGTEEITQPGLTVKANVPDVYDEGGVSYTRLNTTFNPYNCPDNDTNISDIGVIYMRASKTAEKKIEGLSAEQFQTLRNDIAAAVQSATAGLVKGSVTVDLTTNKYNGFKYTVKQDPSAAYDVKLTSKNRVMFTDSFQTSSLAGYTYYVFGVMVYNNYPNADGTTADTPTAICSDNYAKYTFNASGVCEDTFDVEDDKPTTPTS